MTQFESEPVDVLLVGFGAVGGIYAYILEQSKRCRVTAIARSLYSSMKAHGVNIRSKKFGEIKGWRPYRLVGNAEEAADRKYRFIICAFKCLPDVQPTSTILQPFLDPPATQPPQLSHCQSPTTVVLIQNGIGIEQPVAESFPFVHIISCVTWIGANMIVPQTVPEKLPSHLKTQLPPEAPSIEHGSLEKVVFGLYEGEGFEASHGGSIDASDPGPCDRFVDGLLDHNQCPLEGEERAERKRLGKMEVELFASMLEAGGGKAEQVEYIQPARWAKNLWNGALSTMCTLSRVPVSALMAPETLAYTLPVVRRTMLEILYVGRALGYRESELPAQSIDDAIQLTIEHYQAKRTNLGEARTNSLPSKKTGAEQSTASVAAEDSSVFTDDDDEDEGESGEKGKKQAKEGGHLTFKPSMLVDLEMGRPMELEPIIGAVLDRARSKAIETPRLDLIYSALKVLQEQAVRASAARVESAAHAVHLNQWAMRKPSVGGSGTLESRQAWLDEVSRRAQVGGVQTSRLEVNSTSNSAPRKAAKVTGKPLAF